MKTLEEKIKEIESFDLYKEIVVIITQKLTIKNSIFTYKNTVRVDNDDSIIGVFNIDDEKQYNNLIELLKKNQKKPELYTLDEIFKTIIDACLDFGHNDNYTNWLNQYIKDHAKPYQKLD